MAVFDDMDVDTIWMDGGFVDWDEAQVHVLTHALHYGTGDDADGPFSHLFVITERTGTTTTPVG